MKTLIALVTSLATGVVMAAGTTLTFTNNTHYVFLKNDQTPACASAACSDVVGPGQSEQFVIPEGGENIVFSANYDGGAYFGFYVRNQNGQLSVDTSALSKHNMVGSFANDTLTMSATDMLIPVTYGSKLALHGINLSGAEAGDGQDFMTKLSFWIPSYEDAVPYLKLGANTVRFPIRWGYIITTDEPGAYLEAVYDEVQDLLRNNVTVILDLHNYMRVFPIDSPTGGGGGPEPVSTEQMQQVWTQIAAKFKGLAAEYDGKHETQNQLIFEVMNEPNTMDTSTVIANNNAGIAAIRQAGINNLILVEGNGWSGLHSWSKQTGQDGGVNVDSLVPGKIIDPDNNWAVAVHQYFDTRGPYSGVGTTCVSNSKFMDDLQMQSFVNYMHHNHIRVIIDEFGVPAKPDNASVCQQDVTTLLADVDQYAIPLDDHSTGGFIGWTAWQAGHSYTGIDELSSAIWQKYYQPHIK